MPRNLGLEDTIPLGLQKRRWRRSGIGFVCGSEFPNGIGFGMAGCGWSATQPRSAFKPTFRNILVIEKLKKQNRSADFSWGGQRKHTGKLPVPLMRRAHRQVRVFGDGLRAGADVELFVSAADVGVHGLHADF